MGKQLCFWEKRTKEQIQSDDRLATYHDNKLRGLLRKIGKRVRKSGKDKWVKWYEKLLEVLPNMKKEDVVTLNLRFDGRKQLEKPMIYMRTLDNRIIFIGYCNEEEDDLAYEINPPIIQACVYNKEGKLTVRPRTLWHTKDWNILSKKCSDYDRISKLLKKIA